MRGRSSRGGSKRIMETELNKEEEEPHLSGAYIRSLVKQLTSSRSKVVEMNRRMPENVDGDQNLTKLGQVLSEGQGSDSNSMAPVTHHRKPVRRRLHTSRPYQERLLNMAEARREIVAALKFHRASMKQANEQQQQQQPPSPSSPLQPPRSPLEQVQPELQQQQEGLLQPQNQQSPMIEEGNIIIKSNSSCRNPKIYPSNSNQLSDFTYHSTFYCSNSPANPSWPSQIAPPAMTANLNNVALPNQTLGLNLNFHDFNNLDASPYRNGDNNPSIWSSSCHMSSSSSSSSSSSTYASASPALSASSVAIIEQQQQGIEGLDLHQAMDDKEMAEMRSIGEQYQMEWNDRLNLVTSAWWFKFLKSTTDKGEGEDEDDGGDQFHPYDQVMEFPAWLNANDNIDSCFHRQYYFNDHCLDELQEHALP